jgi:hypothetical protein
MIVDNKKKLDFATLGEGIFLASVLIMLLSGVFDHNLTSVRLFAIFIGGLGGIAIVMYSIAIGCDDVFVDVRADLKAQLHAALDEEGPK